MMMYADDNLVQVTISPTLDGSSFVTTLYAYDAEENLTSIRDSLSGGSTLSYSYNYDLGGRLTQQTTPDTTTTPDTFTYDADNQLLSQSGNTASNTYAYDANGNRLSTNGVTSTPGVNNQIANDGTYSYSYDHEGNLTSKVALDGSSTYTYSWDYRDRLTSVVTQSGGATSTTQYLYDDDNERIAATTTNSAGTSMQHYVYDAGDQNLLAVIDGEGFLSATVTQVMLAGPNQNQVLAQENMGTGTTLFALTDNIGSVVYSIGSSSGNAVIENHNVFDAYGNLLTQTNATYALVTSYAGYQYDANSGFYYDNARWYNAHTGTFVSQDPSGFSAGDDNLYRYVGNQPTDALDATGLYEGGWLSGSDSSYYSWNSPSVLSSGLTLDTGIASGVLMSSSGSSKSTSSTYGSSNSGTLLAMGPEINDGTATDAGTVSQRAVLSAYQNQQSSQGDQLSVSLNHALNGLPAENPYAPYDVASSVQATDQSLAKYSLPLNSNTSNSAVVAPRTSTSLTSAGWASVSVNSINEAGTVTYSPASPPGVSPSWDDFNQALANLNLAVVKNSTDNYSLAPASTEPAEPFPGIWHPILSTIGVDQVAHAVAEANVGDYGHATGYGVSAALVLGSMFTGDEGGEISAAVESPYQVRIDPNVPGRPDPAWSIDTRTFTQGESTANGGMRNNIEFWSQWVQIHPETISPSNAFKIQQLQLSPKIDQTWIQAFPEHTDYLDQTLVHHHVDQGPFAIPVPSGTHVGFGPPWH